MEFFHPAEITGLYKLAFSFLGSNPDQNDKVFFLLQEACHRLKSANMIPSDLVVGSDRLHKVINMTTSDHQGEAINGAREMLRLLKEEGDIWKFNVGTVDDSKKLKMCHVTQGTCPLLERLLGPLQDRAKHQTITNVSGYVSKVIGAVKGDLPCNSCHSAERFFKSMALVRFGKVERKVLLLLLDANHFSVTTCDFASRSQRESWNRAVKKLIHTKLVVKNKDTFYRTILGAKVIAGCRTELMNGEPIRWDAKISDLLREHVKPERMLCTDFHSTLLQRFKMMTYRDHTFDQVRSALSALDWALR